jgi:hypothetical protein
VTSEHGPTMARADAARLLHEMAAVVRTIFAVDAAAPRTTTEPAAAPPAAPVSGGTPPAPVVPASIPVPGMALLHEIAFLDD